MGLNFARDLAETDSLTLERQIGIHLTSNFYPPIPSFMVQPCVDALNAYWNDETDAEIEMPEGVNYRGGKFAPAHAIVEQHRLDPWLNDFYNNEEM